MTDRIEDGGAAFPRVVGTKFDARSGVPVEQDVCTGMTVRDYFAIHATQPGATEIAAMAGLTFSAGKVWSGPNSSLATFNDWWRDLPAAERFDLCAKVRYAEADAMIRARQMGLQTGGRTHG
jgi:hypothetical protein